MSDPPAMRDLLGADAPSNWGKWGPDDEVGALNYLGPEQVLAAVQLVSTGKVFTLQRLIGDPKGDPVWPGGPRPSGSRFSTSPTGTRAARPAFPGGLHYADDTSTPSCRAPRSTTRWATSGTTARSKRLRRPDTVGGLDKASVQPIAESGVVGRGVLIDMARHRGKPGWTRARPSPTRTWRPPPRPRASRSSRTTSCACGPAS